MARIPALRTPWRSLAVLCLTALSAGGIDCAQERDPINRVRENALPKSFFVGAHYTDQNDDPEFYANNFVVDGTADNAMMPVGTYDDVDRIRWEIQEDFLLARKSYEYVEGSEGRAASAQRTPHGVIVAAYRIESQFDQRRAYNSSTGEEINVVEENTADRRWPERDFIRVDWSRNLVNNPDWSWVWYGSVFGELSFSPVAWSETNPAAPDANNFCEMTAGMVRDRTTGACVAATNPRNHPGGYLDVTSKWLVNPENSHLFEEPIPTCLIANFFANGPVYSCAQQETVIRTSFRRVEDHDFEPLELTRQPYDLVGGPRAERNGYDPGYGLVDHNFHRFAMIHNLWQHSHLDPVVECAANTDANADGTADACGASDNAERAGSQCDTVTRRCTMPYRRRAVRPIAYYTNTDMPPEMQDHVVVPGPEGVDTYRFPTPAEVASRAYVRGASEDIIDSWDRAIMSAIANAREVECRRTGGDRGACHTQFFDNATEPQGDGAWLAERPKTVNGPAVVICHNPVRADDSTACREPGYAARLGDVRFNHITYIPGRTRAPFGGIAHWGYDPLTGEVVSNGGTNIGRSAEYAAAQQRDFILLALGELDVNDYVSGAAAQRFASVVRNPASQPRRRFSDQDLAQRVLAVNGPNAARDLGVRAPAQTSVERGLAQHDLAFFDTSPVAGNVTRTAARVEANQALVRNTTLEADMVDEHWLANLGIDPHSQRTQGLLDQASPLRRMDPEVAETTWHTLLQRLERRGFCFQDMGAAPMIGSVDLQGVARYFARKYAAVSPAERSRRIYNDLRVEAYKGIALHEIGHSLGLYHLPVSSYDSMNYNPQYWQLRTRNGTATQTCTPVCTVNNCSNTRNADVNQDNCMGPRYLDPASDEELGLAEGSEPHAGIDYFGNTSVMEYQWERFDETVGLGSYDHYAMGILYGRVLETMESDPARGGISVEEQSRYGGRLTSQLSELDQIRWTDPVLNQTGVLPIHYTELARQMALFDPAQCRDATPAERARYAWRLVDGKICRQHARDHAAMVDFESGAATAGSTREAPLWRTNAAARTGPLQLRWGYRVAWDIGTGYPHINYFDQGADVYEVTQSNIRKYELTYPTLYFRRNNREYSQWGIPAYLSRNIFRRLRGYHWSVARDTAYYSSVYSAATYSQITRDDNYLRPLLVSGTEIFDFFAKVILRPEVGTFEQMPRAEQLPGEGPIFDAAEAGSTVTPAFEIGLVDGRFIGEQFDNAVGGSWDYHSYLIHAGSYPEKPIAAIMLTDTRPTFSSISRSLYLDGREYQVNFRTDMPQAFDRLLGGVLSEDWDTVAMHVPTEVGGGTGGLPALEPALLPLWTVGSAAAPAQPRRPAGSRLLFPNIGYRQQLPMVVWSMLFSSLNSNLDTIHRTRIFTEGGPEAVDIAESERTRFRNPETGITYVARRYGPDSVDGEVIDSGIASRMIAHANALLADTYQTRVNDAGATVYNPDGSVDVVLRNGQLVDHNLEGQRQVIAVTRYRNYVGLIDATRYASRLLGYGTLH
jgi:hypothetical protein